MGKHALILVDLQNDYFPAGKWPLHNIESAAQNAAQLLKRARKFGELVIHVRHETPTEDATFFIPDSEGAQIHESVAPLNSEMVVLKNHANSFRDTDLDSILKREEIETVTVCGAMSHMCVDATVRAAYDLEYSVIVIDDACATRDLQFRDFSLSAEQVHATFMSALNGAYATMTKTEEILNS